MRVDSRECWLRVGRALEEFPRNGPLPINQRANLSPNEGLKMNVMLVSNVFTAIKAGYALKDSETWKNRQTAVNAIAAVLSAALAIAQGLGYGFAVSNETMLAISGGIWAIVGVFNSWATLATSGKVGLPVVDSANSPPSNAG